MNIRHRLCQNSIVWNPDYFEGYGSNDHYGGHHKGHGGTHKEKVHPLGYYYCKKGHCSIDGYCTKKPLDYHRRPVQSLHYHRRPHYTRHHFYEDQNGLGLGGHHGGGGPASIVHHHQGNYLNVGDYHAELPQH